MKLPTAAEVSALLGDLLGKRVTAKPTAPVKATDLGFAGKLQDPTGSLRGITFSDRAFAAYTGAGLAMIPRNVADDAIKKGQVPANLLENHDEVVNIATALINSANQNVVHVKLGGTVPTGPTMAADVKALMTKPASRADFVVDIDGYGSCKFSFLVGA
jgi:hypothetical protein